MRTETIQVYHFNDLSPKAKEKARQHYRAHGFDYEWYDTVFEDAKTVAEMLGIDLVTRKTNRAGHEYDKINIQFSGFSSQGDGASWEGRYAYKARSVRAVKRYAPKDERLHRIAEELCAIQKKHFYKLVAKSVVRGTYSHSGCMDVDVWHADDEHRDIGDAEKEIRSLLRRFGDWIYRQLEADWNGINTDEAIDETLEANQYEYWADGRRYVPA